GRILGGGDLAPQLHGVGPLGALGSIGALVVPVAVLQRDGDDVGDGVVQGLPGGVRIVLLRVVRPGADHVVGVVAGVDHDRGHVRRVGQLGVGAVQSAGQVDQRLRLVLGGVLLGIGAQDALVRFARVG